MTVIQLTFPWGRYYAHPWGINPARLREPEWPPSPWRLLRALVSVWFRAHPGQAPSKDSVALIEALGRELPEIGVGKVSFGSTVHWQPNYGATSAEEKADAIYKKTRHENHFAAVPGAVFFCWRKAALAHEQRGTLETLLAEITYFGRAESLCHAELCKTEPPADVGWCQPVGGRRISAACRDVFCPDPEAFQFADLWSRRGHPAREDQQNAPPHLVDTLLSSDMKADGAAWFSYQMPDGWPAKWVVRVPRAATPTRRQAVSEGPKVAHYLCFSLQCRVPILPKFIVPVSEQFRAAAMHHLCKLYGDVASSFALFGHAKDRPADAVGDHQHAFYLPMSECGNAGGFLSELHVWCPYGFTQAEIELLLRIHRLNWGSGRYPVRPVLTALSKEPPTGAPFAIGRAMSKVWRSASPFVPPRYFYRSERTKVKLKEKDRPEWQLIACVKAAGVASGGHVWRQSEKHGAVSRLQSMPPLPLWDVIRAPGSDEGASDDAVAVAVHQNGSDKGRKHERRVGMFFEIEFDNPTALRIPAFGHSAHFGLGLFVPVAQPFDGLV